MEKLFYALHLIPSRSDFAITMSEAEKTIMDQHIVYWTDKLKHGNIYAFGPVIDPKGIYGLGVIAVDSERELKEFIANDPANKINKYEYFPMYAKVPKLSL